MPTPEAEILEAEARLQRAVLTRDLEALDRIIADDALFTGPDGSTLDKATDLETHRSGRLRVHALIPKTTEVRLLDDDTAELVLVAFLEVEMDGQPHEGTYRYTRTYARRDGERRIVHARAEAV